MWAGRCLYGILEQCAACQCAGMRMQGGQVIMQTLAGARMSARVCKAVQALGRAVGRG